MASVRDNNKRIMKNTFMLYIRMFFLELWDEIICQYLIFSRLCTVIMPEINRYLFIF